MNANYNNHIYGWDKLSKVILVVAIILSFSRTGKIIGGILVVYAFWRSRSKDIDKRTKECMEFENLIYNIKSAFQCEGGLKSTVYNLKEKIKKRKYFIITRCPNCSQKLRLPKGKGNILVTCPRCSCKFKLNT